MVNFSDLSFPEAPKIVTAIPGDKSGQIINQAMELDSSYVNYPRVLPIAFDEGKGATLRDVDGNIYIDFLAGISVMNFGYSNPVIMEYVNKQMRKLTHCLDFPTENKVTLLSKLNQIAPLQLKDNCKIFFPSPTGSEAVTAALRLAKLHTGRTTLLSFWGGYHGSNGEALAVSSWSGVYKCQHLPMLPDVHFLPFPYCYRCPFGMEHPSCNIQCLSFVKDALENGFSGFCKPAAMIMEVVQGEGGIHVPPKEFVQGLRKITEEKGIVLIFDEIQCGMGRTGKFWACEHYDTTPDIITSSKSIGGLGLPFAAMIYKKEFDDQHPGTSIGTFRGNALAMAGSLGALDFIDKYNLLAHVEKVSQVLNDGLKDLQKQYEVIGDVRHLGLMSAVEFVKDRKTKEPWPEFLDQYLVESMKRGLIQWKAGYYFNVARMLPPLVVTVDMVNKALTIIEESIKVVLKNNRS